MNRNKKSTVFIAICLIVALASGVVSSASILKYHGTTKEVILSDTPAFLRHLSVAGIVPILLCVVNAITCAGQMCLKNLIGFSFASSPTNTLFTPKV